MYLFIFNKFLNRDTHRLFIKKNYKKKNNLIFGPVLLYRKIDPWQHLIIYINYFFSSIKILFFFAGGNPKYFISQIMIK